MTAFEAVSDIIRRKKEERRRPLVATSIEIYALCPGVDFSKELDQLAAVRILIKGRTINCDYYKINGDEE